MPAASQAEPESAAAIKTEDAHHIEISGGTVDAWSNYAGAGIGGGKGGSGYDISITGGKVKAQGYWGAGIGGGVNGNSGNILIKDTTLTVQSLPLFPSSSYKDLPAAAVGRGSNRTHWMSVMQNQEYLMHIEENIKIGASDGKSVWLSATGWQWRHNQEPYKKYWGTTTELLIPNENGRVDLQRLSLPYAYNYGRVISKLELRCEESTCSHELGWTDRDGCHIWACVKCGARDPAAEMSKQNAKHIPGDWGNQKQLCTVCGHVMGTDTKAPVLEGLKDGESYTVEDIIDGNPGAYTFTVSDPAASGETSSGIKSVTINGEPQTGPTYRLPAPDGGNNDAGAEHTVVATDNAGNTTMATVKIYRWHHVKVISPDGNGTASASPAKAVVGTEITLTATPNEGYHFKEWEVMSGGVTIENDKFTMPDSDVEVKAIFEEDAPPVPAEYTVRFNANGGDGTMEDVTGVSGSYTLPACGFTEPEGKQFKGWSTSADGSVISGTTYEVSSDTTFYAIWESKEYSIIVTDGKATIGAGSEISKAAQGTTITLTANAAPDGKVFDKWVVESGSTTLEDANSETTTFIMPDSEVSVKATYKNAPVTTYSLTTQVNGGHGTISASKTGLTEGFTETVIFTPDDGYEIDIVTVNGVATDVLSNILNVTMDADKTVIVTYKAIPHTHTYDREIQKPETLKSAADCTNDEVYFKSCSCGEISTTETFTVAGTQLGHAWASVWSKETDNHWKECSRCHEKKDEAAHDFKWVVDREATATKKGSKHEECKVCSYNKAAVEIPATGSTTKPTDPTQTNPSPGAESPKTGDNNNLMMWIALLFISGGILTGVMVFDKRKRHSVK